MPAASRVSRRAALAVGANGLFAISGCGQQAAPPPRPAGAQDPDEALVEEVADRIAATAALSGRVPDLTRMHAAHLAALETEPPAAAAAPRRQLLRAERELQAYLEGASLRAESGALARLLASMSASVSQHLAAALSEAR